MNDIPESSISEREAEERETDQTKEGKSNFYQGISQLEVLFQAAI